jgi:hypothetical protein
MPYLCGLPNTWLTELCSVEVKVGVDLRHAFLDIPAPSATHTTLSAFPARARAVVVLVEAGRVAVEAPARQQLQVHLARPPRSDRGIFGSVLL